MFPGINLTSCLSPEGQTISPKKKTRSETWVENKMESLLLIVSGASKGFGKAVVDVMCLEAPGKLFHVDRIHLILVARSADRLEEIGRTILQYHDDEMSNAHSQATIKLSCHSCDLADMDQLDDNIDRMFQGIRVSEFDRAVFVNNHGSIGFLGPCAESPSLEAMKSNVQLNITSNLWLSSRFAKLVKQSSESGGTCKATLVNISSLLAVECFPSMGIYGAGKAARDHFHKTMAQEIPPDRLKILNYAPGPLETDMIEEIRLAPKLDESLKPAFEKKAIDPKESAMKLAKLILVSDFESGSHVDYYDLPDINT